jgi:3-oxoacyl-[acyl-carrier-protein] synthase-1
VNACGTATEKRVIKGEDAVLGDGLAEAIARAIQPLRLPEQSADELYCDINGERYRSEEWSMAVLRVPYAVRTHHYTAPVDVWGDVGAASGPLSCVLAVRAWARGYARGPRALLWAGSEAGLRAASVLHAPEGA